jgi:hypothetical protein
MGLASMIAHGWWWIRMASAHGDGASVGKRVAQLASVGGTVTQCLVDMGDRACMRWALAIWPVDRDLLKPGGLYFSNGLAQFPQ